MPWKHFFALGLISLLVAGCTGNPNMIGLRSNFANAYSSLEDRRKARLAIKIYKALPKEAHEVVPIKVQRCHQYINEDSPTDSTMTTDLILAAYAQGKDGITDLKFNREGGLFHNCWFIQNGEAVGFRVSRSKK